MLRAILFDFNGVLLDDEKVHFELFRRVLGEEGIDLDEDTYYQELVHFDDLSGFREALIRDSGSRAASLGVDFERRVADLCARKSVYYREQSARSPCPFFAGAVDLVRCAADSGLAVGIVSGALRQEIELALRRVGLEQSVRLIVAAEDVPASKPDPSGYLMGYHGLNEARPRPSPLLRVSEVLAIEDTIEGLRAASDAGLRTLGVAHTLPIQQLQAADWTIGSLSEIRLADLAQRFDADPARSKKREAS